MPIADQIILAVFPAEEDRALLTGVFCHSNWKLRFTGGFQETQIALRKFRVGVLICDGRLPDGHCWKDLLRETQSLKHAPRLIVADRLADERLWGEVLNLGAYDLLTKPFNEEEVLHTVSTARRQFEDEQRRAALPKPLLSPVESGVLEPERAFVAAG